MRLLSADANGDFSLTSFDDDDTPSYAVLSHTWEGDDQEVSYHDLVNKLGSGKQGYRKIRFCGERTKNDGLRYFWVDSCSIDKSSSAEHQTAINSMFRWYQKAAKCYVYLSDVTTSPTSSSSSLQWQSSFRSSRWFTRGWTLQELLAPRLVEFFSRDGMRIGDKDSLAQQIHEITMIPIKALQGHLSMFSYDERKLWAVNRRTKLEEDLAYCLLGIFDVYLPLIYGEGRENAFRRLQFELDRRSGDQVKWSDRERECMQTLRNSAFEYEQFKDRNPTRQNGTCQWVLQHENFRNWTESRSSSLLWISADPGCGKSVLAKSLIDEDFPSTDTRTTCYFFFKDDNDVQQKITTALSAVLHQLFSKKQMLVKHIMSDFETNGDILLNSFHLLWKALMESVADPKAGEVFCILDALDECEESGRYQIINALSAFYQEAGTRENAARLRICVTSRPYLDIERRFADLSLSVPTIRLRGEQESDSISREINIVIRSRVSKLGSELKLNRAEQLDLETELLGMTHRTYLWLTLILDIIRKTIRPTSRKLKAIISTLPSTVDKAYEAILSRIEEENVPEARRLLQIIVAAVRPLTLTEMNIALAIEDHHRSHDDLDLDDEARFETSVRNLCGLFVTVVDQKVYLIHQTAREFLIAQSQVHSDRWKHSLCAVESDEILARACITYLLFPVFDNNVFDTAEAMVAGHGFASYAAKFWALHFRQAQSRATEDLLQSVFQLYDLHSPRSQNWFRVYCKPLEQDIWSPESATRFILAACFGHQLIVQRLIENGEPDLDVTSAGSGGTPLLWAANNGHHVVVQLLLETGRVNVEARDRNGQTPLSLAAERGRVAVVKVLLQVGEADVDARDKFGWTPLSLAAGNGHEDVVAALLGSASIDVNAQDPVRRTPLSWAAENGHEAVVRLLLRTAKVDVNLRDKDDGLMMLRRTARLGNKGIAHYLLNTEHVRISQHGENRWARRGSVNLRMRNWDSGRAPLSLAAGDGHEAVVRALLESSKTDVETKDGSGRTPLSWAAGCGHDAIVKLLLDTGKVDLNNTDTKHDRTPLRWAARNGHKTVVKLLLEAAKDASS